MKKTFLISALSFISLYSFAQSGAVSINNTGCLRDADMPANALPAWPKTDYTPSPVQDPSCAPCYEYKNKRGTAIMECPFLIFQSQAAEVFIPGTSAASSTSGSEMNMQAENTYTGNYPACSKKLYPPHTNPVWPKTAYTPTGNPDCAPCYEYTNKRGTVIMECPYLVFPSEKETTEKNPQQ